MEILKKKNMKISQLLTNVLFALFISGWTGPALAAQATITVGDWSSGEKEAGDIFTCPANAFIVARAHNGDENGDTRYKCGTAKQNGQTVTAKDAAWSANIKESDDTAYNCASKTPKQAMTGRQHAGDENGNTKYQCSTPIDAWNQPMNIITGQWSPPQKEAGDAYECANNTVMIGRKHTGDENGNTSYLCGQLW
jgi:hypothetical protein